MPSREKVNSAFQPPTSSNHQSPLYCVHFPRIQREWSLGCTQPINNLFLSRRTSNLYGWTESVKHECYVTVRQCHFESIQRTLKIRQPGPNLKDSISFSWKPDGETVNRKRQSTNFISPFSWVLCFALWSFSHKSTLGPHRCGFNTINIMKPADQRGLEKATNLIAS